MAHNEIGIEPYREAILIREVEQAFLDLFAKNKLNGTVHTCVGQEFSAIATAGALSPRDYVTSNHRCHGHFIAFTKDWHGLVAELLGKEDGVCAGIGSSQHLHKRNFFSNGVQGSLVPVGCGFALANKLSRTGGIAVSFIGDGTLGEGVVYESMNLAALWELPLLIVCENNRYAQSTAQSRALAGDIAQRAGAFGFRVFKSDTWNLRELFSNARLAIDYVRKKGKPAFHLVDTYRLNPHSRGDDTRDRAEVDKYRALDPLVVFEREQPALYADLRDSIRASVLDHIDTTLARSSIGYREYAGEVGPRAPARTRWTDIAPIERRQVQLLTEFFDEALGQRKNCLFIGEDVLSPYGGAFKVARGLSEKYPAQVLTTPISEAAIVGLGIGLGVCGFKPYVEIMFGDFVTLAFDQLLNNASKFHHMYNRQVTVPLVIRTPMGGRRGYGPTHSQTLDKFLVGIDNVTVIALNALIDPREIYRRVHDEAHPTVVIENKTDYGRKIGTRLPAAYVCSQNDARYPTIRLCHRSGRRGVTVVSYGGIAADVVDALEEIEAQTGVVAEFFAPTRICPLDLDPILESVGDTGLLVTVEEGSAFAGLGGEIVAALNERTARRFASLRISADPVPIPSIRELEDQALPGKESIVRKISDFVRKQAAAPRQARVLDADRLVSDAAETA